MKKKGMSSIIVVVLTILFTAILGTAILIWSTNFVRASQEQTTETNEEAVMCAKADPKIRAACLEDENLVIVLENPSRVAFEGLNIRVVGTSNVYQRILSKSIGIGGMEKIEVLHESGVGSIESVEILPMILVGTKEATCRQHAMATNVKPC